MRKPLAMKLGQRRGVNALRFEIGCLDSCVGHVSVYPNRAGTRDLLPGYLVLFFADFNHVSDLVFQIGLHADKNIS